MSVVLWGRAFCDGNALVQTEERVAAKAWLVHPKLLVLDVQRSNPWKSDRETCFELSWCFFIFMASTPRFGIDTFSSLNDFLPPECHVVEPEFIVECFDYDDERPLVMTQREREVRRQREGRLVGFDVGRGRRRGR